MDGANLHQYNGRQSIFSGVERNTVFLYSWWSTDQCLISIGPIEMVSHNI